jgi:uncharacterized phage-associated protein
MVVTTANHVAEALINLSHEKQDPISNLKLQKLLYYAQAWHLALYGKALFNDPIEAWVHGPVVPSIFRQYKAYRWAPVSQVSTESLPKKTLTHLEEVWRVYGKFSAGKLERLTHSEEPWKKARAGMPIDAPSHNVISLSSIKNYYCSLIK